MKLKFIFSALSIVLFSCGARVNNSTSGDNKVKYQQIAVEKLGTDITYVMNDSKAYVLCTKDEKASTSQPRNLLSFLVINLSNNAIVLEQKIDGGSVKWYDDDEVEVFRTPGIMRNDQTREDFITLYNVKTGKSSPKKGRTDN